MRRAGGVTWGVAVVYVALLTWALVGSDARFLRRLAVRIYAGLEDLMPREAQPVHYEIALNVLLFVPLGYLALRLTRRPIAYVVLGTTWIAVMYELIQTAALDRSGSVVDVIATSAGAMVGAVIAAPRERS